MSSERHFGDQFVWGAAAASYQIEGAAFEDGKGLSIWDVLCERPGAIFDGHTGAVACDHYHRYAEDIELFKQVGLRAYRFSISWPRVLPDGKGQPNEKGLEFYDRLIDSLLEAGIEPYATMFHWDLPQELFIRGGWLSPEIPKWFGDYAALITQRYSDRVKHWMTLNEPQVFVVLGHWEGRHAPALRLSLRENFLAIKHTMLAHGHATLALRANAKQPVSAGIAPCADVGIPIDDKPENIEAARQHSLGVHSKNPWPICFYLDPVLKGVWRPEVEQMLGSAAPTVTDEDLKIMHQPLDYLGLNFYQGPLIKAGADGKPEHVRRGPGFPHTAINWPMTPEGLYWLAKFYTEGYGLPVLITENGLSSRDWVGSDGKVHDNNRIDFTRQYLQALHRAVQEGAPVLGYLHWSIMDNFEWAEGYKERFGMIHVDYETQKRTIKESGHWYRRVIETNGAALYE